MRRLAALVAVFAIVAVAHAQTQLNQIYSQNPGAESGTTEGWTNAIWAVQRYSDLGAVMASSNNSVPPSNTNDWLFAAHGPELTLSQSVSLAAAADEIDAGKAQFAVIAFLGGTGPGASSATVVAQVTDADGRPQGTPVILGPPTARDRGGKTELIGCADELSVPPGSRGVFLTVESTQGTTEEAPALADDVFITDHPTSTLVGGYLPAEGENCQIPPRAATPTPTATASPTPTPTATATATATPESKLVTTRWLRPRRPDGFKATQLTRRARHVKIELLIPQCGVLSRISVKRTRRSVRVSTIYSVLQSGPYTTPSCPSPSRRVRQVSLRGRLGRRTVTDGSTHPAKVRYRRPRH